MPCVVPCVSFFDSFSCKKHDLHQRQREKEQSETGHLLAKHINDKVTYLFSIVTTMSAAAASNEEFMDFLIQQIINLPEGMPCFLCQTMHGRESIWDEIWQEMLVRATVSLLSMRKVKCPAPKQRCIILPGITCTIIMHV